MVSAEQLYDKLEEVIGNIKEIYESAIKESIRLDDSEAFEWIMQEMEIINRKLEDEGTLTI
jgi:hypothetical protein